MVGSGPGHAKTGSPKISWRPGHDEEEAQEVCCGSGREEDGSLEVGSGPSRRGDGALEGGPGPGRGGDKYLECSPWFRLQRSWTSGGRPRAWPQGSRVSGTGMDLSAEVCEDLGPEAGVDSRNSGGPGDLIIPPRDSRVSGAGSDSGVLGGVRPSAGASSGGAAAAEECSLGAAAGDDPGAGSSAV